MGDEAEWRRGPSLPAVKDHKHSIGDRLCRDDPGAPRQRREKGCRTRSNRLVGEERRDAKADGRLPRLELDDAGRRDGCQMLG
jgi:hypothetical protein